MTLRHSVAWVLTILPLSLLRATSYVPSLTLMHSNSDAVLQRLGQCICDVPREMLTHVHLQSVTFFCRVSDAKKGTLRLTFYL